MAFKCLRCGECCYPRRLNAEDIARISGAGFTGFVFRDHRNFSYIRENPQTGYCMFLDRSKPKASCNIYSHRPTICRKYPSKLYKGSCKPVRLGFDDEFV